MGCTKAEPHGLPGYGRGSHPARSVLPARLDLNASLIIIWCSPRKTEGEVGDRNGNSGF